MKENTSRENNSHWNIGFQSTKSGAGEQFLLLDCRARACAKGVLFSQTPVAVTLALVIKCGNDDDDTTATATNHHDNDDDNDDTLCHSHQRPTRPRVANGYVSMQTNFLSELIRQVTGVPRDTSRSVRTGGAKLTLEITIMIMVMMMMIMVIMMLMVMIMVMVMVMIMVMMMIMASGGGIGRRPRSLPSSCTQPWACVYIYIYIYI